MTDRYAHESPNERIKRITKTIRLRQHAPRPEDADITWLLHQVVRDDDNNNEVLRLLQEQLPLLGRIFSNINQLRETIAVNMPSVMGDGAVQPQRRDGGWSLNQKIRIAERLDQFAKEHPGWVADKDVPVNEPWCEVIVTLQYEDDPRHCQNVGSYTQRDNCFEADGTTSAGGRSVCGRHMGGFCLTYGPRRAPVDH